MKPEEIAIDTSVLVAALVPQHPDHPRAASIVEELDGGTKVFHCSTFVPVETCGVLSTERFAGRMLPVSAIKEAKATLDEWVNTAKIKVHPLTQERMAQASGIAIRQHQKGPDSLSVQIALELGLLLETYDGPQKDAWQREQSHA